MKIAILGAGKMGSWFATGLANHHEIAWLDPAIDKLGLPNSALRLERLEQLGDFNPELLLNAVTLHHTISAFKEALPYLSGTCVLGDIASVKGELVHFYRELNRAFVSIHPMFGPTYSNINAPVGENAIIIAESTVELKQFFSAFFSTFGVRVYEYTFAEHDQLMAHSLTMPFVSSLVFAASLNHQAVPGTTFAKHKEIAIKLLQEDDHLLSEVLFNRESLPQLERITSRLEFLKHVIRAQDKEELIRFLNDVRARVALSS